MLAHMQFNRFALVSWSTGEFNEDVRRIQVTAYRIVPIHMHIPTALRFNRY